MMGMGWKKKLRADLADIMDELASGAGKGGAAKPSGR